MTRRMVIALLVFFWGVFFIAPAEVAEAEDLGESPEPATYAALVVGVPQEDYSGSLDAGVVHVLFGSESGTTADDNQMISQDDLDPSDPSEHEDHFGYSLTSGDFNGDGFPDLAIGVSGESVPGVESAGAVRVVYGTPKAGLQPEGNQIWTQDSDGILNNAEENDWFGHTVAAGDFNGDGYDDLVVGVPYENYYENDAGVVHVIFGSPTGLTSIGNELWSQVNTIGSPDWSDQFGYSLAVGDFGGDGFDDLAIGVPLEGISGTVNGGVVHEMHGGPNGLTPGPLWHQGTPGILGDFEAGDHFGATLTSGDFNGDGADDLAIGAPKESLSLAIDAGAVAVIYGVPGGMGLDAVNNQLWYQDSPGILGDSELNDDWGERLAAGDFNGDGIDDLAVGVPKENISLSSGAGAVNVIYGTPTGLSATDNQLWHQGSPEIQGGLEIGDHFGDSLTAGDFNGDGVDDLAIGVPREETEASGVLNHGIVQVIYGSASGLSSDNNQLWSQDDPLIPANSENEDEFGLVLTVIQLQLNRVVFGPETIVRGTGGPAAETLEFSIDGYEGPFTFHLSNGDENGDHRVTSGWVYLNGDPIMSPPDFDREIGEYEIEIPTILTDPSTIQVTISSGPAGALVTVWIEGIPTG